eukprot:366460-Chlamydomonas_euryale.AAC.14
MREAAPRRRFRWALRLPALESGSCLGGCSSEPPLTQTPRMSGQDQSLRTHTNDEPPNRGASCAAALRLGRCSLKREGSGRGRRQPSFLRILWPVRRPATRLWVCGVALVGPACRCRCAPVPAGRSMEGAPWRIRRTARRFGAEFDA